MPLWYYFSDILFLAASDYNRGWSAALKELDTWRVFESFLLLPPCCTVSWDMLVSEVSGSRLFLAHGVQIFFPLSCVCLWLRILDVFYSLE